MTSPNPNLVYIPFAGSPEQTPKIDIEFLNFAISLIPNFPGDDIKTPKYRYDDDPPMIPKILPTIRNLLQSRGFSVQDLEHLNTTKDVSSLLTSAFSTFPIILGNVKRAFLFCNFDSESNLIDFNGNKRFFSKLTSYNLTQSIEITPGNKSFYVARDFMDAAQVFSSVLSVINISSNKILDDSAYFSTFKALKISIPSFDSKEQILTCQIQILSDK